jgi:hypothetical protein
LYSDLRRACVLSPHSCCLYRLPITAVSGYCQDCVRCADYLSIDMLLGTGCSCIEQDDISLTCCLKNNTQESFMIRPQCDSEHIAQSHGEQCSDWM